MVSYCFNKVKKGGEVVIKNPSASIALSLGMAFSPVTVEEIPIAAQLVYAFTKGKMLLAEPINLRKVASELFVWDKGFLGVCKSGCYAFVIGQSVSSFLEQPLGWENYAMELVCAVSVQTLLEYPMN